MGIELSCCGMQQRIDTRQRMNPSSDLFGWAILVATGMGPVLAVLVTRWIDERRETSARQLQVFRQLMANRRAPVSADFVAALNLVEIEFYQNQQVIEHHKELIDLFNADLERMDEGIRIRHNERIETQTQDLLFEIGKALGYKVVRLDLKKGGYLPNALSWREQWSSQWQHFLAEVALGKRSIPVSLPPADEREAQARREIQSVQSGRAPLKVEIVQPPSESDPASP